MSVRFMTLVALIACATLVASVASGAGKAKAKPDFKAMDADADSKIVEAEFTAYVVAHPELGLTEAVFQAWDRDKDGNVTIEEYEVVVPMKEKGKAKTEKK